MNICKLFVLSLLNLSTFLANLIVPPPYLEHLQGTTPQEITEESLFGLNFKESEINKCSRCIEETYGELGTEGREENVFKHASLADSLHKTKVLFNKEEDERRANPGSVSHVPTNLLECK